MRDNKIKNQSNIEKLPIWFIITFICLVIASLVIVHTIFRNFTDIEIVSRDIKNFIEEGYSERVYTINNTGNLVIWNLKMHVLAKNQYNHTVFDNEIPIISELPRRELAQAFFKVDYGNNTYFDVDIELKWSYFNSKTYHDTFPINDIALMRWYIQDNWTQGPHRLCFVIHNTGELPIWNLSMHVLAKNQNNRIVLDTENPIASIASKGEILDANSMINYFCNDSYLDIIVNFKWDFFRSKEYRVQWKQDDAKILFSQNNDRKTLTVLGVVQKNLRWENNVTVLEGSAKLPSGIIKEGDVITDCSGTVTLGFVRNHRVIRYLGQWDFNQNFSFVIVPHT